MSNHQNTHIEGACVAVAGPVKNGEGALTNLDWQIDHDTLAAATGANKTSILNDLQAQGHSLSRLKADSLFPVIPRAEAEETATRMVVNVGTGFNIACAYYGGAGWIVPAAEAGHTTLPCRSSDDLALGLSAAEAEGHPSVEDILSGRGLKRIYSYLGGDAAKAGAAIVADFEAGNDEIAAKAAKLYARSLGDVVGNFALTTLPFGDIYLSGGVNKALAKHLEQLGFVENFKAKGRFEEFMEQFGVNVIIDDFAPLTGCASHINATLN